MQQAGRLATWDDDRGFGFIEADGGERVFVHIKSIARLANRRMGELPPWAPSLADWEKRFIHRAEQVLYAAMLVMPVSGFVYVMAGGYGVHLFGAWHLPNPIGSWPTLATAAKLVHQGAGWVLLAAMASHIGLVLRHQLVLKDGLLWRMLPGRQPPAG